MPIVMRLEHVGFVDPGRGIVLHIVVGDPVEGWRFPVAGVVPGLLKHQIFDRDELERPIGQRFVDQDSGLVEIGVRSVAIDARVRRLLNAEDVRAKEMNAHRT